MQTQNCVKAIQTDFDLLKFELNLHIPPNNISLKYFKSKQDSPQRKHEHDQHQR